MIQLSSIIQQYDTGLRISFPDWQIPDGARWLMLGRSGSGKTTLLHILSGLLRPVSGEVEIDGTSLYRLAPRELDRFRGSRIGLVFQRPHLISSLTVEENLQIAQQFAGLPQDKARIREVLDSLSISDKSASFPGQLSQGQLQRVSIARAVINRPALLIADEPTASLDDDNAASALELLFEQSAQNGATLVVATHDQRIKPAFNNTYQL
ncbi:ATP-binding cassette domain-containing protein [Pedobacter sp. JY14-1]|uniref:ABC transporter ATP-binding protein n=1 Tax=Pedobacter sp. JY14-1 TaxID=3034151 RepID=UPI0023E28329|nr:ATP-binding cassette domain-containing protein [Pedobacter sp. JY14-1]